MPQQQRLQLLACLQPRPHRIFTRARQISQRLIACVRNHHFDQLSRAGLARQQQRIAPIGFDPISRPARDLRRGDHLTRIASLEQLARQPIATRPGFVHHL
jgi:hypothetical protein